LDWNNINNYLPTTQHVREESGEVEAAIEATLSSDHARIFQILIDSPHHL
jgi:hypothetical protein